MCLLVAVGDAGAQGLASLRGRVVDERDSSAVTGAWVILRAAEAKTRVPGVLLATTDSVGRYRFDALPRGRYSLSVNRPGYRSTPLGVVLDRSEPFDVSILVESVPFQLDSLVVSLRSPSPDRPSLVPDTSPQSARSRGGRPAAERVRQRDFLAGDVRQLSREDVREADPLLDDDVFRALQKVPGVARRDDFTADLWTRGAPAGQSTVLFDGVPLYAALHGLGVLGGLDSDMLSSVTFQPGVADASWAGAGASVVSVESRSPANAPSFRTAALSPISARFAADGRLSRSVDWSFGARRSYIDLLSSLAQRLTPGQGPIHYAFDDVTGRVDAALSAHARVETSVFTQRDQVTGDVADLAQGNQGAWGTMVARTSLVTDLGGAEVRNTLAVSRFDASVRSTPGAAPAAPLYPTIENHVHLIMWETRLAGPEAAGSPWSAGVTALRERHTYQGPGLDLTRLLSPEDLGRRGIPNLAPLIRSLSGSGIREGRAATRLAFWGQRRGRISSSLEVQAGLRLETGDAVESSPVRWAPRIQARYRRDGSPLSVSAAFGRVYQYAQPVTRTDVVRSGLRASEVLMWADSTTPALRSDVLTVGLERWVGDRWLVGATGWLRAEAGILLPAPGAGVLEGPRAPEAVDGKARGVELSVRKLAGRVRGFANYSLSRAVIRADGQAFPASEDRLHVANVSVVADVWRALEAGVDLRAESGAPFTRLVLISSTCPGSLPCAGSPSVVLGTPNAQRGPPYASLNLMSSWSHDFRGVELSVFGQLHNALGRKNAVTYHWSCLCTGAQGDEDAWLGDRFDRGLPRIPVVGLRVRF